MSLKKQTFSAIRWNTAAAGFRTLLQLAQLAVLARLLAPQDYGLMAMVELIAGFAVLFADMGINAAFVQRQDVTLAQRSSLFWLNVAWSVVLALSVSAASPLIALYFDEHRLPPLIMLFASTIVISALGQQVRMSAEKALNFGPVVVVEVMASLLGFGAAIGAALAGWGVYALLVNTIVKTLVATVLAWVVLADGWRPVWRFRMADVRPFLGFGGALVANNFVNQLNVNLDLLLGGRLLPTSELGFYSVPRRLVFQIQGTVNPIITRVGFPLIAQVQADLSRVRSIYLKTLNMTASTNAPIYIGIAFFAPEVVRLMLGERWLLSADLLRIFAVWGYLRSTGNPVGSLLLGMGRAKLSLQWSIAMLCIIPPGLWYASQYGPLALAWGLLLYGVALFIPGWWILVRGVCRAGLWEYTLVTLRPGLLAVLSIAPGYVLAEQFHGPWQRLACGVATSLPLYLSLSYLLNQQWFKAMEELMRSKRTPSEAT